MALCRSDESLFEEWSWLVYVDERFGKPYTGVTYIPPSSARDRISVLTALAEGESFPNELWKRVDVEPSKRWDVLDGLIKEGLVVRLTTSPSSMGRFALAKTKEEEKVA